MKKLIFFVLVLSGCTGSQNQLRWNYLDQTFEYAEPTDILKYNYFTGKHSYQPANTTLKYNAYEKTYEWSH